MILNVNFNVTFNDGKASFGAFVLDEREVRRKKVPLKNNTPRRFFFETIKLIR